MDASRGKDVSADTRRALGEALDRYLGGQADLKAAAQEAGMKEFDFLQEATSLPDPVAAEERTDLPTFVRGRGNELQR